MTDKYIGIQLKFSGGIPNPIISSAANAGTRRLTVLNIVKLLWGFVHGGILRLSGGNVIMVQDTLVAASATATPASVVTGNTISIAGTALTATQGRATGTVTPGTAGNVPVAADTITLNSVVFTAVAGAVVLGEATFDVSGTDAQMCTSIAAQVNAYASPLISGIVAARASATVVTFYAVNSGTSGNAITLATNNNTRLAKSGTVLANGAALTNNQFDFAGSDITTGVDLARAINNSTTAADQRTTATASSSTGVVTITAKVAGPAGNAITLTSVGGTITVTGSGFLAGGSAGEPVQWSN
jgi:hypothetical protein